MNWTVATTIYTVTYLYPPKISRGKKSTVAYTRMVDDDRDRGRTVALAHIRGAVSAHPSSASRGTHLLFHFPLLSNGESVFGERSDGGRGESSSRIYSTVPRGAVRGGREAIITYLLPTPLQSINQGDQGNKPEKKNAQRYFFTCGSQQEKN